MLDDRERAVVVDWLTSVRLNLMFSLHPPCRHRPKVAPYAFTTVQPMVGHVEFADHFSFSVADIPGLIDGAHENRGLGHEFLRHIQRTKVLCFVIDAAALAHEASTATAEHNKEQLEASSEQIRPVPHEAVAQYLILDDELRLYDEDLGHRPRIIVLNQVRVAMVVRLVVVAATVLKSRCSQQVDRLVDAYRDDHSIDTDDYRVVHDFVTAFSAVTDAPVLAVSARERQGLGDLAVLLREQVERRSGGRRK